MILMICLVFLLMSFSIVASGVVSGYIGLKDTAEDNLRSIGQMADETLSSTISGAKKNAESLAREYDFCRAANMSTSVALNDVARRITDYSFTDIALIRSVGGVSTQSEFLKDGLTELPCVSTAISGTTTLSSSMVLGGELRFLLAVPCRDGCLVLTLPGTYFSAPIQDVTVGQSGNVFMVDDTGTMIANARPELVENQENFIKKSETDPDCKSAAKIYTRMISGEPGIGQYRYAGRDWMCCYAPVQGSNGWSYGVVAPMNEMMANIKIIVAALLICSALYLFIGLIVIARFASKMTTPIIKISERMGKLAQGDLSTEVEVVDRQDEIGALAQSFYTTVEAFKAYIRDIHMVLKEVSNGNLLVKPEVEYTGDFSEIRNSLDNILSYLNHAFCDIGTAADQVSAGAEQVSTGAQALSQGATEQASSVEELAATIQDISTHVRNTADHTVTASEAVRQAYDLMQECDTQMQGMEASMDEISRNSQDISKIIKTIEDIAFQTNILALNAAVEAARAGEAGKGFAVVADEVRNLASKSAEASKNTSSLIAAAVSSVARGTQAMKATAEAMERLKENSAAVAEVTEKISVAASQQSTALEQVTQGVDQISSVVQTNSATSEESAAASEEMSAQAQMLRDLVNNFRFTNSIGFSEAPAAPVDTEADFSEYTQPMMDDMQADEEEPDITTPYETTSFGSSKY